MRTDRRAAAQAAIAQRMRARRIAAFRRRQAFAQQPEAERRARLDALAQLAGKLEAGSFNADELREAEAALLQGDPCAPQQRLRLGGARHA